MAISPPTAKSATPADLRAATYRGDRRALGDITARMEPFGARWEHRATEIDGKQFAELSGVASVAGVEYEMWDVFGPYGETIAPGVFPDALTSSPGRVVPRQPQGPVHGPHPQPVRRPAHAAAVRRPVAAGPRLRQPRTHRRAGPAPRDRRPDRHRDDRSRSSCSTVSGMRSSGISRSPASTSTAATCRAVNYGANPYTSIGARARSILGELDYLPAGAQRAALSRLTAALDLQPAASVAEAAAEAGCEDEVRPPPRRIPGRTDPRRHHATREVRRVLRGDAPPLTRSSGRQMNRRSRTTRHCGIPGR